METAPAPALEEAPAAPPAPPEAEGITLETPIRRGDQTIAQVRLRKPGAGELRGLQLQALLQGDVGNMLNLLPRITVPPLSSPEVEALDPADLAAMTGEVQGFFMSKAEQAALAKALGIDPATLRG